MWARAECLGIERQNLIWKFIFPGYNQVGVFIKTQCECLFLPEDI